MVSGAQSTPPAGGQQGTGLAPNIAGLLCYIGCFVTGIIFLMIERENKDVRFHAWQSTVVGVAVLFAVVLIKIFAAIMGLMAGVLEIIVGFFVPLVSLAFFIVWIVCMVKAYQGERWRIPVIGDFAAKKAGVA